MNTDPIADLLTRMRNALMAKQDFTLAPYSKLKIQILDILKKNDFIKDTIRKKTIMCCTQIIYHPPEFRGKILYILR